MYDVGDRVKLLAGFYVDNSSNPTWGGKRGKIMGTVSSTKKSVVLGREFCCSVVWDNKCKNSYKKNELIVIHKKIILPEELFEL